MKISVKVKPGSKVEKIIPPEAKLFPVTGEEKVYKVWVKEKAIQGQANDAVIRALARHFKVPLAHVIIKSGRTAKTKIIEIQ